MNFLVGTDPESFAVDENNNCIPPVLLRRNGLDVIRTEYTESGTPHPVFYDDGDIKIIEDGVAVEYTVKPSSDPEELYTLFNKAVETADKMLESLGVKIVAKPVVNFDFIGLGLDTKDEEAFNSCIFGCDASLNVYSGEFSRLETVVTLPYRFAGGHIHISPMPHSLFMPFTQLMDIFVGCRIVVDSENESEEVIRNQYYGQPGTIRLQNYPNGVEGVEYRPPSVSWLSSLDRVKNIYDSIGRVMDLMGNAKKAEDVILFYLDQAKYALNHYDKEMATRVMTELGVI